MSELPRLLAIDLSFGRFTLALAAGTVAHYREGAQARTHSAELMPALTSLLADASMDWPDLELIALVVGPGSFTGLRIAAATVAGLNSRLRRPVLPLSALAVTARQSGCDEILVCEDARAGACYVGRYRDGRAIEADACIPWDELARREPARFAARMEPPRPLPGWQRAPLIHARGPAMLAAASDALKQQEDWTKLAIYPQPRYLQPSQAERHAGR